MVYTYTDANGNTHEREITIPGAVSLSKPVFDFPTLDTIEKALNPSSVNLTGSRLRHEYGWTCEDLRDIDTAFETYGPLTFR